MVATRSSAWQSWHDPPRKTEVCLSLSAGQVEASEASYVSLASLTLRRSPEGDGRPRLAWLPRTREDYVHPYWLLTNPYSVFIRWLIRRPLDPGTLSLSPSVSLLSLLTPTVCWMQLTPWHSVTGIFSMHFAASFHLSSDISKQIFFFNKHAYYWLVNAPR